MLSMSKDELDVIIGKGEIDDNKEEEHLKNPLSSILMEPIVQCCWLLRLE
jgi:hypothetical protein